MPNKPKAAITIAANLRASDKINAGKAAMENTAIPNPQYPIEVINAYGSVSNGSRWHYPR